MGRGRCLRRSSTRRGFANLPATSFALLCIEMSVSMLSSNLPPKRYSPSLGIRTAAETLSLSRRPIELNVMLRQWLVAKSRIFIYLFIYFKSLYRVACSVRDWSSTGPCAIKYRVKSDKVHTYNKIKLYKN